MLFCCATELTPSLLHAHALSSIFRHSYERKGPVELSVLIMEEVISFLLGGVLELSEVDEWNSHEQ